MSYPSVTIVKSDRQSGSRRFAPASRSMATPTEVSLATWRNFPNDYPNALASPGIAPIVLKPRTILLFLLLAACLLPRLVMALRITSICPDGVMYIRLATALEEGRFRDAFEGMNLNLYPPLLMLLHGLGLSWEAAGEIWGVLISSLVVLPLFGLVRRQFDDRVALISCLLYAVHPVFLQWSSELIRDPTFWFFFTCTLYLLWRAATEVRWRHFLLAGVTLTLAVLTRFEGLFLLIPLVFWSVWRYRALEEKPLRRRLLMGAVLAVAAFPAIIVMVNMTWLSRYSDWVFSRLSPLTLIEYWWNGIFYPVSPPPGTPAELQSLSFLRLVSIYVPALVKGLSPLFAVPMLIGLWTWRRVWWRRDNQPLFYTTLVVMAAAWIHAWCAHESCDRYYLSMVLMGSPFAALGLLAVGRQCLALADKLSASTMFCRLALATPALIVLLGSASIALTSRDNRRPAEVQLAEWINREYGPTPKIFGSEGIAAVIAYHAGGRYTTLTKAMDDQAVLDSARETEPDVILILATRRNDLKETRRLMNALDEIGFHEVERNRLPSGTDDVLVVLGREEKMKTK